MSNLTTITTKGQVTIPEEVRSLLRVEVGDRAFFDEVIPEKKQVTLRVISKNVVEDLCGSLKTKVKFKSRHFERESVKKLLAQALVKK